MKSSLETSSTTTRCSTRSRLLNSTPTSLSKSSRRATRTMLIPEAAICRANSLPIPDEAPVTSAQGPNLFLSSATLIFLLRSACLRSPYAHRGGEYRQNPKCPSSDHLLTPVLCQLTNSPPAAFFLDPLPASPCSPAGSPPPASHQPCSPPLRPSLPCSP